MSFSRCGFGSALLVAIQLCFGCSSTDSGAGPEGGGAGQSAGRGGDGAGLGGQGGTDAGESGAAGESSVAGAGGSAGDGAPDGSEAGASSGGSHHGGTGGISNSAGNGGLATAGATASGGGSGHEQCVWDPAATNDCPVCDAREGCARPAYKYVGSGAITSSCCGLEWQEETAPGTYTWSAATEYCASLPLLGRGWRLPTIAELYSLVDLSNESPAPTIDVEAFVDTLTEVYWTGSLDGKRGQAAWSVNFDDGASLSQVIDDQHPQRVRCVR